MSTGTVIIQRALQGIGAHSHVSPASPESIVLGMEKLNSMLEMWLSQGIAIGFTPLDVPGDDLNEPNDTKNGIIDNLSLQLAPDFDNGKIIVSQELRRNAKVGYMNIKNLYQTVSIPQKVVSSTLPIGSGNGSWGNWRTFFSKGGTING